MLGGWFGTNKVAPTYTAVATVVKNEEASPMASIGLDFGGGGFNSDYLEIIKETHVLKSRYLMGRVVDDLGLVSDPDFNPYIETDEPEVEISALNKFKRYVRNTLNSINPFYTAPEKEPDFEPSPEEQREIAITILTDTVGVESVDDSYVFNISAITLNAEKSANIANAVAQAYIEDQVVSNFDRNETTIKWLSSRVVELKDQLEVAESAVADFDSKTRLVSEADLAAVTRQIKGQRDRILDAEAEIASLADRLESMKSTEASGSLVDMARASEEAYLIALANRATGAGPELQAQFKREFAAATLRLEQTVARLRGQKDSLVTSLADLEAQTEKDSGDLIKMRQLQREAESAGLIYQFFQSRLNEVAVTQGVQQVDSRVLSPAISLITPVTAGRSLGSLGLILGAFLGAALFLIREQMNRSVQTAEELEALVATPVLGIIPVGPFGNRGGLLKHISEKPNSEFNEALRNLRTSLFMLHRDKVPQVILTTSSVPGEGKTTTSVALAMNIAATGKKVILVECDIRRRMLNHYFDTKTDKSIVSLLTGDATLAEVVNKTGPGVPDFILGDSSDKNAADLFSTVAMQKFVEELRTIYDVIVLDVPPVLAVPDARIIAPMADATIFSAHWNKTPKEHIKQGTRTLTQYGIEVTGFVLSRVKTKSQRYKYNYGKYDAYYTD
jgi:capsular exopolysaccharide synthesis family protein